MQGGGGSPEQSQRVVFGYQLDENYSQTSARRAKPRFWPQARALAFNAKGGEPSGFTMAEILLSLTIIGVVAAITLPSLTGNINERTWNTQRKALYARMSQAIALMPSLNGYGTLSEDESGSVTQDTAAETFITAGLSKVVKINNICDNDHLQDCGVPSTFNAPNGDLISSVPGKLSELNSMFLSASAWNAASFSSLIDTKVAAFETANGESILVYYNPQCKADMNEKGSYYIQPKMCANFIYDLNGEKGPNTVGKDVGFITAMYPTDPTVVAPIPALTGASNAVSQIDAGKACQENDPETRIPSREELYSLIYNIKFSGLSSGWKWSSFVPEPGYGLFIDSGSGYTYKFERTYSTTGVWCVKR